MKQQLTIFQAYKAMYAFVRACYYDREKPEVLGLLLTEMQLADHGRLADLSTQTGQPVDPAVWADWLEAVKKVLDAEQNQP
jgi:hypothetical protein